MDRNLSGVLVYAEQNDGEIHPVSYELLQKGGQLAEALDEELIAVVLGPEDLQAEELIYRGANRVYHIHDEKLSEPDLIAYKKNLEYYITEKIQPEIILLGATPFGRSLAPRLAITVDSGLTADCTDLQIDEEDNRLIQIRPAFSENILAHIKSTSDLQMATVRYQEFDEAERDESLEGEIIKEAAEIPEDSGLEILEKLSGQDVNITEEDVIVAGGKGLKNPEDFTLLEDLAEILGGELGASRDVVDEDYISKEHQVGYSGHRVKPTIYIAAGISGAPQHLAGMKEADTIIAINNDPSAPIFEHCDYGIVGDLYDVVPVLIEQLKEARDRED